MSIPNTPEDLRAAAERAENTGQPRLAALYTKKAEHTEKENRRAALSSTQRAWEDIGRAFKNATECMEEMAEGFRRGWNNDAR